ncbi:GLYK [Symbiodinium sp. CCMP2592]|nr:GLYK [Symbiodinium sp. CCMP2592]
MQSGSSVQRWRQSLPLALPVGLRLLLDAQSRIGTWLSAVDAQADSTASRSLPGQAETPDASEQVSPLPQPKVSAAARRLQEWRLTRESTLTAETEAPHAATVSAEPKQERGESGKAQPSDPFVEATVGEAVVRIRISEEESKTVAQLAATFEQSNVPKGKADATSALSKTPMQEEGDEQPARAREAERADEAPKGPEDKVPSSEALQAAAGKLMERVKAARERKKRPEEDGWPCFCACEYWAQHGAR